MDGTMSFLLFIILISAVIILVPLSLTMFYVLCDERVLDAMRKRVIRYFSSEK